MKKIIPESGRRIFFAKQMFDIICANHKLEPFVFQMLKIDVYMDTEKKLQTTLPDGSLLYLDYLGNQENNPHQYVLTLSLVNEEGKEDVYADVFDREVSQRFYDDGLLPDADHSNVARKLQSLGIEGPFEYLANIIFNQAQVYQIPEKEMYIILEKNEYNSMLNVTYSAICYTTHPAYVGETENVLKTFLADEGVTVLFPDKISPIKKLYEFMDAQAEKVE